MQKELRVYNGKTGEYGVIADGIILNGHHFECVGWLRFRSERMSGEEAATLARLIDLDEVHGDRDDAPRFRVKKTQPVESVNEAGQFHVCVTIVSYVGNDKEPAD